MRRSQQINSRKLSTRLFRKQSFHRRLKQQWLSSVVRVLRQQGRNNRLNRMMRRAKVLGW